MQLRIAFIKFCALLAMMALLAPVVWADGTDGGSRNCPEYVKATDPIFTKTNSGASLGGYTIDDYPPEGGVPFDYLRLSRVYNFDKSGFLFYRKPVGYSYGSTERIDTFKPYHDPVNAVLPPGFKAVGNTSAEFWMPSGRYVERGMLHFHDQVCEHGRPPPGDHEYIVSLYTGPLHSPYSDMPGDEYDFSRKSYIDYHGNLPPTKYGLEVLSERKGYHATEFGIAEENSFDAWILCGELCIARFFFPQTKIFLVLRFEYKRLAHWKESMNMAVKLLSSWHVDLPSHPSEHQIQAEIIKTIKMNEGVQP